MSVRTKSDSRMSVSAYEVASLGMELGVPETRAARVRGAKSLATTLVIIERNANYATYMAVYD